MIEADSSELSTDEQTAPGSEIGDALEGGWVALVGDEKIAFGSVGGTSTTVEATASDFGRQRLS